MSYILEALKKSDQERQRGQMPGLQTVQAPVARPQAGRRVWPYVLAAALLLNAAVLAWWLSPWQSGKQETATRKLAAVGPPAAQVAATPSKPARTAASPQAVPAVKQVPSGTAEAPAEAPAKAAATRPGPKAAPVSAAAEAAAHHQKAAPAIADKHKSHKRVAQTSAPAQPAERSPAVAHAAKPEPAKAESRQPAKATARQPQQTAETASATAASAKAAVAVNIPNDRQLPDIEHLRKILDRLPPSKRSDHAQALPIPSRAGGASAAPAAASRPPTTKAESGAAPDVPHVYQLPGSVQKNIQQLSLSFLVYSKTPRDRMVSVNGKMLREGQQVSPGLTLQEITPNGAIFTYEGHRFFKGVF